MMAVSKLPSLAQTGILLCSEWCSSANCCIQWWLERGWMTGVSFDMVLTAYMTVVEDRL